jgi:hypothetical protein
MTGVAPKSGTIAPLDQTADRFSQLLAECNHLKWWRADVIAQRQLAVATGRLTIELDEAARAELDEIEVRLYSCAQALFAQSALTMESLADKAQVLLEYVNADDDDIVHQGAAALSRDFLALHAQSPRASEK